MGTSWNARRILWLLALPAVLLFLWFVWPTRYRYGLDQEGSSQTTTRTDRITGRTDTLTPGRGWVPQHVELGSDDFEKLKLEECRVDRSRGPDMKYLQCDIHNGSDWVISEVVLTVPVQEPPEPPRLGPISNRNVQATNSQSCQPGATCQWVFNLGSLEIPMLHTTPSEGVPQKFIIKMRGATARAK